jgi:cytochrome c biogenesis protein CcmG/thiol:disulfide interchange protein DsbE
MLTQICWRLVDIVSRTFHPDERDAVCGDLAESGTAGGQALRDVLGLVIRRQAELWKDWHPWLALGGLVGVAGVLLSDIAFRFDAAIVLQVRTYWRHGVHFGTGLSVGEDSVYLVCLFLALFSWSWTSGFVLGSLSGRATWLTGTLFCLVVHGWYSLRLILPRGLTLPSGQLWEIVLDLFFMASIPMLPFLAAAIWGMNRGVRLRALGFRQALLLAASVAGLTSLVTWTSGWYERVREIWSEGVWHAVPWPTRLLPLAIVGWPVAYMLVTASVHRWGENQRRRKMNRMLTLLLTLASVAAAADQAGLRVPLQPEKGREPAADFALQDVSGKTVNLADFRGKVVLLDFWATWCTGCKKEIPWFEAFQAAYGTKGFAVVGVSLDEDGWKVLKPFLEEHKIPYTMLLGDDPMSKKYGIGNLPDTFLIDRQGRVAALYKEGLVDKDNVEANIKALLSEH